MNDGRFFNDAGEPADPKERARMTLDYLNPVWAGPRSSVYTSIVQNAWLETQAGADHVAASNRSQVGR